MGPVGTSRVPPSFARTHKGTPERNAATNKEHGASISRSLLRRTFNSHHRGLSLPSAAESSSPSFLLRGACPPPPLLSVPTACPPSSFFPPRYVMRFPFPLLNTHQPPVIVLDFLQSYNYVRLRGIARCYARRSIVVRSSRVLLPLTARNSYRFHISLSLILLYITTDLSIMPEDH